MQRRLSILLLAFIVGTSMGPAEPLWGFYGHRLINRLAVYTVPAPLVKLYKKNIDYLAEHAVDPDKRRYATKHEGVRHYIDIDVWGDRPFEEVPRELYRAVVKYGDFKLINEEDTLAVSKQISGDSMIWNMADGSQVIWPLRDFHQVFRQAFMPQYYEDVWLTPKNALDTLSSISGRLPDQYNEVWTIDNFSSQGILPFHLERMQYRLRKAFEAKDKATILRLSAEYGHYIGDAHVPLHTTVNYNGQLTDQVGIHAFWESRIPELFAESQYDFLVGTASYVDDVKSYVWQMVADSHAELDSVLLIEKELSHTYPSDKQYCYDERLSRTIRIQCPEYAAAYQARMGTMVERRMQASIKAIGDLWYTAWVDAGMPDVDELEGSIPDTIPQIVRDPNLSGVRAHDFE